MQINLKKLLENLPKDTTKAKKELGNFLGSQDRVYYRLHNPKAAITPDDLKKLAEFFECSIDDLIEEEKEKDDVFQRHGLTK